MNTLTETPTMNGLRTVTPEDAERFLNTAAINRPLKQRHVDYLARQILEERWHPTAGTLGLNEDGQLVDGQHRCWAIIEAGKPVEIGVRLIRAQDVLAVDTGAGRSAGDLFGIRNIDNPNETAASIRLVTSYRASVGKGGFSVRAGQLLSNEELWGVVKNDSGYIRSAGVAKSLRAELPFLQVSRLAALHYLFAEAADAETATRFLKEIRAADDGAVTTSLYRWLLRAERATRKPAQNHALVLVVQTWNRWLRGQRGRVVLPNKVPKVTSPPNATQDGTA